MAVFKIGEIARLILKPILESGKIPSEEIVNLQDKEYSKDNFDLNYPFLVKKNGEYDKDRYYVEPVYINDEAYMLCSQWYEQPNNNDKPLLILWIMEKLL